MLLIPFSSFYVRTYMIYYLPFIIKNIFIFWDVQNFYFIVFNVKNCIDLTIPTGIMIPNVISKLMSIITFNKATTPINVPNSGIATSAPVNAGRIGINAKNTIIVIPII